MNALHLSMRMYVVNIYFSYKTYELWVAVNIMIWKLVLENQPIAIVGFLRNEDYHKTCKRINILIFLCKLILIKHAFVRYTGT